MDAKTLIAKGRSGLVLDNPFFGSLILRLTPREDPACQTMWTDGKSLGYNPGFVEGLSLDKIKGVLCHEILHCANQHTTRRGERDSSKWNEACDYAINPIIVRSGMSLPEGALMESVSDDRSAEQIYASRATEESGSDRGKSGEGQSKSSDPGGCGEVRDLPSEGGSGISSEAEKKRAEQEWKIAVAQAATQARQMGDLPAGVERMVEDIIDPKLNWREILHRFIDSYARNEYQWFPPNRRYVYTGLYLPSTRSEELGSIALAVDTSGSIEDTTLKEFASEIADVTAKFRADVKIIYCDTEVYKDAVQDYAPDDRPIDMKPVGGGGTDFRPPFNYLEEIGLFPPCMIYFTDGWCDRFPEAPAYPVLWVVYGNNQRFDPPFGEVVNL
jgi:predicted metal-dependent peptidase